MQVLYLMHVERVVACVHVSVHHEADKAAVVVDRKREVRSRISCKILQEEEMGCNSRLHRVGAGKLYGGKSLLLSVRLVGRLTHGICCPPIPLLPRGIVT